MSQQAFEKIVKAAVSVTPAQLREHREESKRAKELAKADTEAVRKGLDRS